MNAVPRTLTGLALLVPVAPAFAHDSQSVHSHAMGPAGVILLAIIVGLCAVALWRRHEALQHLALRRVRAVRKPRGGA